MKRKEITSMDVAKILGVEKEFTNVLTEQELKKQYIEEELRKTEEDFFNDDPVDIPK